MSIDESKDLPSLQDVGVQPSELNAVQKTGYDLAKAAFTAVTAQGYIDPRNIHRILDFGAGLGGPTLAFVDATRQFGTHIDAVEKEEIWTGILNKLGALPPENIIISDGILYLKELRQKGIAPYDLITAFQLGPDGLGRIFRELAVVSSEALNPNGNLLVTSDNVSMSAALKACDEADVTYHFLKAITQKGKLIRQHTLIVPQSSCIRIQPLNIPA